MLILMRVIGLITGFKGRVFLDKLQQWKSTDWDIYHLMFAPDSLKPADINLITNMDNFRDISQLYRLGDPDFYQKVPRKVMVKLAKKLKTALGNPSTWSYLHSNLLLPYIVNMPPKVLKRDLTASMLSTADCDLIKLLGRVFRSLTTAEMQSIPDSALAECIDHIAPMLEDSCADNKRLCKKVWEKVKTYATGQGTSVGQLVQNLGDKFLRYLPEEDIQLINIEDVGGVEVLKDLDISPNYVRDLRSLLIQ
ncbi:hypothetical protein ElyMa_001284000 [Elysia marginata]|uniref:SAM domain-containing protein n=1 Tax=Elysia marginata TaxID=1093978 RepID=A0AAV4IHA7_9GAST|nr:hypothetical protein ElyMa_001284000 [Elysia marginata]